MMRITVHMLIAAALAAGLSAAPAWSQQGRAQQGWAPVVVSALPDSAARITGERNRAPPSASTTAPASRRPVPRPIPEAKPALMQVAVQERKPATAAAAATSAPAPAAPAPAPAKRSESPPLTTAAARQFCVNIADAAAEAKFAWQRRALADLQTELDQRIALVDAKTAELQKWVERRDEFSKKARDNLVLIYARMRPDAAAMQLTEMDQETAAAVLVKLDARISSAILNEMQPAQAARLTATIAGAARTSPKGSGDRKS